MILFVERASSVYRAAGHLSAVYLHPDEGRDHVDQEDRAAHPMEFASRSDTLSAARSASAGEDERRSVLSRALGLLDAFGPGEATLSVAELVRRSCVPKSTVHRLVAELVRHGLLERAGGEVCLGIHLFELGCRVPIRRRLREVGLPFMEDLYETTHQVVQLGVIDGTDVLCMMRINGHSHLGLPSADGTRVPAHAAALGKAMLAFSPRAVVRETLRRPLPALTPYTIVVPGVLLKELAAVARAGLAFDHEESVMGAVSVAAPLFMPGHPSVAAISVTGPVHRFDANRVASAVRLAAAGITRRLGGVRSSNGPVPLLA